MTAVGCPRAPHGRAALAALVVQALRENTKDFALNVSSLSPERNPGVWWKFRHLPPCRRKN